MAGSMAEEDTFREFLNHRNPRKIPAVDTPPRAPFPRPEMSEGYQVIARRWRPQQFDEIVGQEHIVRTLKNAIETNRIGHAYLFVGPRGTGKTTTARIFAKALNCTGGPKVAPDADDPICKAITNGSCTDVIEIDAASNRSIDDAKTIREECQYTPAMCTYKIFIIDEVHQLTRDAFNTLLKTLEEPPPHIKFIFATTESDKVLATITSRCQRFEFQPIPEKQIAGRLRQIVQSDGIEADDATLLAIARLANGGMRDSQSILDQVISFCGKKITAGDVANIYGLLTAGEVDALAGALVAADYAKIIELTDKFCADGRDLMRALQDLQERIRTAIRAAVANGNSRGYTNELGGTSTTVEQLLRMLDTLQAGENSLKRGLSERANFEVTLLKASEQGRSRALDTLVREIGKLAADLPNTEAGEKKIGTPPPADDALRPLARRNNEARETPVTPPAPPVTPPPEAPPPPPPETPPPVVAPAATEIPAEKNASAEQRRYATGGGSATTAATGDDGGAGPTLDELIASGYAPTFDAGDPDADPDDQPAAGTGDGAPAAGNHATAGAENFVQPPALPGSEEYETALNALPAALRQFLDDQFHIEFTDVVTVPERQILRLPKTQTANAAGA
jgi:DNA polymerase-3 subunit gamma/tau